MNRFLGIHVVDIHFFKLGVTTMVHIMHFHYYIFASYSHAMSLHHILVEAT